MLLHLFLECINRLQTIQNKALRCIFKLDWRCPTQDISKLLTVKDRMIQLSCRHIYESFLRKNKNILLLIKEYLDLRPNLKNQSKFQSLLCIALPRIELSFGILIFCVMLARLLETQLIWSKIDVLLILTCFFYFFLLFAFILIVLF